MSGPCRTSAEALLKDFQRFAPAAPVLETVPDLALYLAVLQQARMFVSSDIGPLHFAAGLGVPTLALFGPDRRIMGPRRRAAPFLIGSSCTCGDVGTCQSANPCMETISPEQDLAGLQNLLKPG